MTKNQNGYTMLLAIGCLLIVTILGLSLMRITASTYTKNETRADHIQADALATKGADYLIAQLNYLLEKEATTIKAQVKTEADNAFKANQGYDGYTQLKDRLIAALDGILEDYSCDNEMFMGNSVVNNIDKYGYCVQLDPKLANPAAIVPTISDDDPLTWYTVPVEGTDGLQQIVALRSKGDVGAGKAESNLYLRKVIGLTLGGETAIVEAPGTGTGGTTTTETITESLSNQADIPVALQYALSTKKSGASNNHQEDGAVYLHGGIDVYGGLNIDGNLYVGNYGMPGYNSYIYASYPRVFEHQKGLSYDSSLSLRKSGTVNVSGDVFSWAKYPSYSSTRHDDYLRTPSKYKDTYGLTKVSSNYGFSNSGVNVKNYNAEAQDFDVDFAELKSRVTKAFETNKKTAKKCTVSDFKVAFVNCNNSLTVSTSKSELLLPKLKASQNLEERGGIAYLKGLTITGKDVKLQGTFFIDGNFTLTNGSVLTDAVIYVTGSVNIDGSDINSLDYKLDGKSQKGTLLIFANNKIDLNGISVNYETPSNMKAFLYSKQDIEITGSTSHVLINGGISARSIELTGMRGPYSSHDKSVWKSGCSNMSQIDYCQSIDNLMTLWNHYADPEYNVKAQQQVETLQKEIDTANNKITELNNQIVNLQNQIEPYQKQISDLNSQISSIDKQLNQWWGLSSKKKKELESQKTSLVEQRTKIENLKKPLDTEKANLESQKKVFGTQITNDQKEMAELEKPADVQTATLEKHMRSRLTVYYNPDIIITYEQHGVKPAEIPDFSIAMPTDYDRIKQ